MPRCTVLALTLLFVVPSFAQDETKAGFLLFGLKTRVGLSVGVNFSTASIEPEPTAAPGGSINKSGRTDVIVSFPLEVKLVNAFSVRLEPTYTQYGYSVENKSSFFSATTKVKKNYLETPITASYNFGGEPVAFFGFFGGVPGFRFCSEEEFLYNYFGVGSERPGSTEQAAIDPAKKDARAFTSKFHFGITVGGGAEYALNNGFSLVADVRYTLGLTNTYKKPDNVMLPPNTPEPSVKLRGFQIRVGGMYSL